MFTEDTGTLISTPDLPVVQLFMNLCSEKILDVLGCIIYVVFHEKVQCEFLNASIFFQESFNLGKKSFRWKFSSQNVVGTPSTSSVLIFTQSPNMQANGLVLIFKFTTGDKTFFLNLIYCCYSYLPFQQGWAKITLFRL